jgi:cytochrome b561
VIEVPAGFLMAYTYAPGLSNEAVQKLHFLLGQIHHTNGFLILLLAGFRLAWRYRNRVPQLPSSFGKAQKALARGTHIVLYGLLFLLPLSGWLALSVLADSVEFGPTHIWFFTTDGLIPRIASPLAFDHPYGYSFFAGIHIYLLYASVVFLGGHVLAALWHHLVRRDGILLRMWPGTTGKEDP